MSVNEGNPFQVSRSVEIFVWKSMDRYTLRKLFILAATTTWPAGNARSSTTFGGRLRVFTRGSHLEYDLLPR